ncbi:elastin [Echeneis naucrates]|uniref:elastin n=1 Tax=Echeneis naucrates TaxID=173247 RepID=UPI001113FC88|nr:elastin-like [Echeneis naucrates]
MLVRALIQTSLVLWLAQQTLQGGVKPQSVSWGRVVPARGVGIGVKPGVGAALGALGSRYPSKAMKTGSTFSSDGRYPGAQLGNGGYRSLGLGAGAGAGLRQGAYGAHGPYGASLPLGAGPVNGLGLGHGLSPAGKRSYGAGLGTLPGYGALAGTGYPGARPGHGLGFPTGHKTEDHVPGVSAADLGGPELAGLGQDLQDLRRKKGRAFAPLFGEHYRPEVPHSPEFQAGGGIKLLDPAVKSSSPGSTMTLDKPNINLGLAGGSSEPVVLKRKSTTNHGEVRQQLPLLNARSRSSPSSTDFLSSIHQNPQAPNFGSTRVEVERRGFLPRLGPHSKDLGQAGRFPPLTGTRSFLPAAAARQGAGDLSHLNKDTNGFSIRGTFAVENHGRGSLNLQVQERESPGPVIPNPRGTQSVDLGGQEGKEPKLLNVPRHAGRNNQAARYLGGAGNYLGAGLAAGGYGPGLGQGAYLGGAAGKLGAAAALGQGGYPHGAAGKTNGYGEGAAGYLGAVTGNGYGYGNGYSDSYGAGLGYPAELADGAENKAGKSKALGAGSYNGHVQGTYGALGAGLESTGGKYAVTLLVRLPSEWLSMHESASTQGTEQSSFVPDEKGEDGDVSQFHRFCFSSGGGAAQVPYGNAPMIPAGMEGEGGYPYTAQQLGLGAEGAKTSNKYGPVAGYGTQQTGYGAQLGAAQDALGDQAGKFGGANGALGHGYKG